MNFFQGATAVLAAFLDDPQNKRLLRLEFPRGGTPGGRLMLANALDADEGISRDFTYTVEVLSDDASIPLKDIMGKMVTVSLVRDDGTLRYFNGYVFEFRFLRTDGGYAFYQMVLKPWLAYLRLKQDSRIFQRLTLGEICQKIFSNYLERDYRYLMVKDLPVEIMLVQYRESDHNHLHRRLEAAGLHYWYEHRRDGHTFCLSDDSTLAETLEGASDIEYQSAAGAREDDGIQAWSAMRRIGAARVTLGSYDFKRSRSSWAERSSRIKQGAVPEHEMYDYTGAFGFSDDNGEAQARQRMQEIDARGQDFSASSNARNIHPRRSMRLAGHFSGGRRRVEPGEDMPEDKAQRDYLVLSVRHSATNNYQDGRAAESHYRNEFTCMRRDIPWLPGRGFHSSDTRIYGVQTATVIGPAGEEIHTDEYGRIRLRFHWDREGPSGGGGSAFVRVMSGWAGARFGAVSLPRVGQEVVVAFMDGNPDRPLVIGSVYNATHMPPWKLSEDKRQSGIKSRELKGSRGNALRLDDTSGKISAHLSSDHGKSELNLGYLTTATPGCRDKPRGEGAELCSDEQIAVRAAKGLLLTAWKRMGGTDKQLAREEFLGLIDDCAELAKSLGEYAAGHQAMPGDEKPQQELGAAFSAWEGGSNTAPDAGKGGVPAIAITAPAGIGFATPKTLVSYAGVNLDTVAQQHLQMTAGQRVNVNAGKGISLFAHSDGIKAIAHKGKLLLQSQHDETEINAAKDVKFTAGDGKIIGMAKEIVLIAEDGSFIKIGGGITLGTKGTIAHHGASFPFKDGSTMTAAFPSFSDGKADLKFEAVYYPEIEGGVPAAGVDIEVSSSDGNESEEQTGEDGKSLLLESDAMHLATVQVVKNKTSQ